VILFYNRAIAAWLQPMNSSARGVLAWAVPQAEPAATAAIRLLNAVAEPASRPYRYGKTRLRQAARDRKRVQYLPIREFNSFGNA
jgi:hypothetical protein